MTPAVGVLLALVAATPAQAVQVTCGQTISQNTKVSNNLADCPGDGLVVDTDGVVLNLNGKRIDGVGNGSGVRIDDGVDDVIVRGGKVEQFSDGVLVGNGDGNRVIGLTVRGSSDKGFQLNGSTHPLLSRNLIVDIEDDGIFLGSVVGPVVQLNTLRDIREDGFQVTSVSGGLFQRNRVRGVTETGLTMFDSDGNLVRDTLVERSALGGVELLTSSDNNVLLRVKAIRNTGEGFEVGSGGGVANRVLDSLASRNSTDGFLVTGDATQTLLSGNLASRNGEDGIDDQDATSSLRRNTANDNAGFGITAVPGVTDLGGNRARGNDAAPPQCVNVTCS